MICPACEGEGWVDPWGSPDSLFSDPCEWILCPECDGCGLAYCCEGAPATFEPEAE